MMTEAPVATPALATDLYQLTMARAFREHGLSERRACFHLFYRRPPFGGAFAVAAGLADAVAMFEAFRLDAHEIAFLGGLRDEAGLPLFDPSFLRYLSGLELELDLDALPEGTVVFPGEPLLRVTGPLAQCQLVETALLSIVGYQTLVATKAARVALAAGSRPVIELGARRAHGIDAGIAAARASFIGGLSGTSNVEAARRLGLPVRGTQAHSFVMAFGDEARAFAAFCESMPRGAVLVLDTFDVEEGITHAIEAAFALRARGLALRGVRLDSGELLALSRRTRQRLDQAGLSSVRIIVTNDLDEHAIAALIADGAPIDAFGVGTRLVTGGDEPALGAVYKLGAMHEAGGWSPRQKLASGTAKATLPGRVGVRRRARDGTLLGDELFSLDHDVHHGASGDLLRPVLRAGRLKAPLPTVFDARARAARELARLPEEVARLDNPGRYSVRVAAGLASLRRSSPPASSPRAS